MFTQQGPGNGLKFASATLACWVLCLSGVQPAQGQVAKSYDDHKVVQVILDTRADLAALEATGAEILNCVPGVGRMDVLVTPVQLAAVERLGLPQWVVQENVQTLVDAQRTTWARAEPFDDFFLDFHPYGGTTEVGSILWYMNELKTRYPALASMVYVGDTIEANEIWGLRITNDSIADKPAVVYFGAEHAREWITPTAPLYLARHLLENYGSDPFTTDLVDNVEFFLIPVFNVDGYIYTWTTERFWRKNRRDNGDGTFGVDMNRNWGEGWGLDIGSSGSTSSSNYRGTAPFSEPETLALRNFFYAHPNVRAQLDIHSYSQLILWPYGYKPDLPPDQDVYEEVGYAMQALIYGVHGRDYFAAPIYTGIYPVSGGSIDWTYAELGILSLSYELRPAAGEAYTFDLPPEEIIPNNEEVLPATLHLTDSDWVRAAIRFRFTDGLPKTLSKETDTTIPVELVAQHESVVPGTATLHYRYDESGSFVESLMTPTGADSYSALLPGTDCASTPEFYFSVEGDGGTIVTSPRGAPSGGVHASLVTTGPEVFFEENLDTDPGWATQGQWAWGQPTGGGGGQGGGPDPTSGYTGDYVYGYALSGDYGDSIPEYHLTSQAIDCSGRYGIHLSFWRWLGVELPQWDHASVSVSNDGTNWVPVWQSNVEIADTEWVFQDFDLSEVADNQPTVYLRWTMGTTDSYWTFCGWNVDDIRLTAAACGAVAPPPAPVAGGVEMNRYISMVLPPPTVAEVPQETAIRVHMTSLHHPSAPPNAPDFGAWEGRYRWVNSLSEDHTCPDSPVFENTFRCAVLGCQPEYRDWAGELSGEVLYVTGAAVVPSSRYDVAQLAGTCQGNEASCAAVSGELAVHPTLFGDMDADPQLNVLDVAEVVDHLKGIPGSLSKPQVHLQPNVPDALGENVTVLDVATVVNALKDGPYGFVGDFGPCTDACPGEALCPE